jgi:hypothetical protein
MFAMLANGHVRNAKREHIGRSTASAGSIGGCHAVARQMQQCDSLPPINATNIPVA